MNLRQGHRAMGVILLLPLLVWAVTGMVFFIKPGYGGAYEMLQPKTYALDDELSLAIQPEWHECRYLRTVLGTHLLVRTPTGWRHLDSRTGVPAPLPDAGRIRILIEDAFSANPQRYGRILTVEGVEITTDTGVRITLDWDRLSLYQRGNDTAWIDRLYDLHYLRWTGLPALDRLLGVAGLVLLVLMSGSGLWLLLRVRRAAKSS